MAREHLRSRGKAAILDIADGAHLGEAIQYRCTCVVLGKHRDSETHEADYTGFREAKDRLRADLGKWLATWRDFLNYAAACCLSVSLGDTDLANSQAAL